MTDSKPSNPYYIINEQREIVESGRAVPGAEIIPGRDEMLVWGEAPDITAEQAEPTPYRIRDADGFVRTGVGAVPDYELGPGEQIEYATPHNPGDVAYAARAEAFAAEMAKLPRIAPCRKCGRVTPLQVCFAHDGGNCSSCERVLHAPRIRHCGHDAPCDLCACATCLPVAIAARNAAAAADGDRDDSPRHGEHVFPCPLCPCRECDLAGVDYRDPGVEMKVDAALPEPPRSILQEAQAAVYGPREASYGHPRDDFARIAMLWTGYCDAVGVRSAERGRIAFVPQDVACMMALLKMARLMETPTHRDSWVDIAGYAAAGARAVGIDA